MAIDTMLLGVGKDDRERVERLAEETLDVAGPTGATVVIAHVFTRDGFDDAREKLNIDHDVGDASADTVARSHEPVRELEDACKEAGVDYEIRGAIGNRGEEVVELAKEHTADRVVVGGRRRSPTGKAVFGSVAQEVMISSPCPVTFVREGTR